MLLTLTNFGKFKNKSFEISNRLTIFYGKNESGKTTIFDALMISFSENKKTSSFLKQIKARYGENIECKTNPEIDGKIKLHPQAYGNLYAIRQSEILFDMTDSKKDSKDWEEAIKIKLFSSDIDIGKLISEIKSEHASKAQNSIYHKTCFLNEKKYNIEKELEKLYTKVKTESAKKEEMKLLEEESSVIKDEIEKKVNILNDIKKILEVKKKSINKKNKIETLSNINRFNKIRDFLKQNSKFEKDYSKDINSLSEKINEYEKRLPYLEGKIETIKKSNEEKKNIDYQSIKIRIENSIKKLDAIKEKSNKTIKIVFMALVIALSIGLNFYFKNPIWFLAIIPALPFIFIKENNGESSNILKETMDNLPEIKTEAYNISSLKDALIKELAKIELNMSKNEEEELEQSQIEYKELRKNIEENKNELLKLFDFLNVTSKENYNDIKKDYDAVYAEAQSLYKSLIQESNKMSLKKIDMLEAEIIRELKTLDGEGIMPDDTNEIENKRKEKEYEDTLEDINYLKEQISERKEKISYIKGELDGNINIHKKIIELESDFSKIREEILNVQKRKKALIILEEMLDKLNKKNDNVFESLANDAKTLYNHITKNAFEDNTFIMGGFDRNKISVLDKQNEKRDIEMLSSATKDAVYISMRLAILRRVHEEGRIILLDDPFITFDENRVYEALTFIKEFSLEYNIPVVIFTKDKFIKNFVKDFDDMIIHELS